MKKPQTYRVCAICGKRHAATYGFKQQLAQWGIGGDKAAISCVKRMAIEWPKRMAEAKRKAKP